MNTPEPPARAAAVLAIDGGNSKTDIALVASDGTVLASLRGPGANQERVGGIDEAMRALEPMVRKVAAAAGQGGGPVARHTSACLAGADLPEEEATLAEAVHAQGWSATSTVLNDTFAVLRAGVTPALGERPWGIAAICGAGVNCTGVGPDGRTARYLSFTNLTGNWGGGENLSQQVMWHAMRAEDGRGAPTALREATAAHFGMASVTDVAIAIHTERITLADLLSLTTVLFAAAAQGDPVATGLVERQGEEICLMVLTALRRLGLPPEAPVPVILGGGLLQARNPLLTGSITRRLAADAPGARPRIADTPPVAGAALLGLDYLASADTGAGDTGAGDTGAGVTGSAAEQRLRESFGSTRSQP